MSEFSKSFHLRTGDRRALVKRIAGSALSGVLFPSKNGWVTFVPFGSDHPTVEELSQMFQLPILQYVYAEDHGWAFAFAHDGEIRSRFEANWGEDANTVDEVLGIRALVPYVLPTVDVLEFEKQLQSPSARVAGESPTAHKFAADLGLPRYRWLSPEYVTLDFQQRRLPASAKVIGEPPPSAELPQPTIKAPSDVRADLSALEALALISPQVLEWDPNARSDLISSGGGLERREALGPWVDGKGRITGHGAWSMRFVSPQHGVIVFVYVAAYGKSDVKARVPTGNTDEWNRPTDCIDSTRILEITEPIFLNHWSPGVAPLFDRVLSLAPSGRNMEWVWRVKYFCWAKGKPRWDLDITLEARTGAVVKQECNT